MVDEGDDLGEIICACTQAEGIQFGRGDVVVIAQKIVSKAEGRYVSLGQVEVSPRARELAHQIDKDSRMVELILRESREVVRTAPGVLIVEHNQGLVMANAGIDMSNIEHKGADDHVLLLPLDPDASSRQMRQRIKEITGADVGVIVSDSVGRAWRECTVGLAIGVSGVPMRIDLRGRTDLYGRTQRVSEIALADSLASACVLLMGECDEGRPVVIVSGLGPERDDSSSAKDIVREVDKDLFR